MTRLLHLPTPQGEDEASFRPFDPATDIHSDLAQRAYDLYQAMNLDAPRSLHKSKLDMGGSHTTVTYPPLFALQPGSSQDVWAKNQLGDSVNLYVHVAFCETLCTFCPYDVELPYKKSAEVARYLTALKQELSANAERLAAREARVNSIYIGGGTPTVLSLDQLTDIMRHLRKNYDLQDGLSFCVEGSPLTITAPDGREKLAALKALGVNRLSMGIQSFDSRILKNTARAYDSETAQEAVRTAMTIFDNVNIDLIQDLRGQTLRHIEKDLGMIAQLLPPSVTWYNQRLTPDVADYALMQRRRGEYDDETGSLIARLMIFERMAELGYSREYGDKFVRDAAYHDSFKTVRSSVTANLIGAGSSAYSHANGFFFRNAQGADNYAARMARDDSAIAEALPLSAEEQFAGLLVHGIKYGVDLDAIAAQIGEWRAAHFMRKHKVHDKLEQLAGDGFVDVNGSRVQLTERGRLFENEISRMFYSPSVERRLQKRSVVQENYQVSAWWKAAIVAMMLFSGSAIAWGIYEGLNYDPSAAKNIVDVCQPFLCGT